MALTKCHECESQISSKATTCPRCGAPMRETTRQVLLPRRRGTPERINWPLRIAMGVMFFILALILLSLGR